jgi:hypothetical protein
MPFFTALPVAACTLTAVCAGGPAPVPQSTLVLSLHNDNGAVRTVELLCQPEAGTHPRAAEACSALESAGGDFSRLPVKDQMCPMIYAPVRAEAHGQWRGEPVDFRTEYGNRCQADARSGGVFAF